ncbi:MAG: hypothetical protein QM608_08120 [Caulobacter sp.]
MIAMDLKRRANTAVESLRSIRLADLQKVYGGRRPPLEALAAALNEPRPDPNLVEALKTGWTGVQAGQALAAAIMESGAPTRAGLEAMLHAVVEANPGHPAKTISAKAAKAVFLANDIHPIGDLHRVNVRLPKDAVGRGDHVLLIDRRMPAQAWILARVEVWRPEQGDLHLAIEAFRHGSEQARILVRPSLAVVVSANETNALRASALKSALIGAAAALVNTPVNKLKRARSRRASPREG